MTTRTAAKKIIAIRFQPLGKNYHFDASRLDDLQAGDYVLVTTSRGRELGQVIAFVDPQDENFQAGLKRVDRKATPQDLVMRKMWQQRELEVLINCRALAAEIGVKGVKFARAEYAYDGTRLTFLYNVEGDEKVDLGELRKRLRRSHRKTRVELRQIGPRDLAKVIGGMGACGLVERCCSKFLTDFSPISIRMAKAQGISLNPQEITGMCGRLRCCLIYEYEQYVEARKKLPKRKKRVITPLGEGKVVDVNPLREAVTVEIEDGRRVEFLKHELQPYKELKALERKAKQPCDRHGDGECDCGKDKPRS
jgi:cell fate regulator YaaT (PSP1 superfamily)